MASSRRQLLRNGALALGGVSLSGCRWLFRTRPIEAVCPGSPAVSYLQGPLTIDSHCHVFNGTDLQVREFIARVQLRQPGPIGDAVRAVATVLEQLVWDIAPTGAEELPKLVAVTEELRNCVDETSVGTLRAMAEDGYRRGRSELQRAAQAVDELRAFQGAARQAIDERQLDQRRRHQFEFVRQVEELPESFEGFKADDTRAAGRSLSAQKIRGLIAFIVQNFQFRYVSVHDYLKTYNQPGRRVVDLMVPSLVDYDWFLAKGAPTATNLNDQMKLMAQLAVATAGRVHGCIPYDPMRDVAVKRGHATVGSLALVKEAIERHGFIGVKLYPPMGFAAAGNASQPDIDGRGFWARDWLPPWMGEPGIGRDLDEAMAALLTWCEREQVPVIAHANISNGPNDDFEALAGPAYWKLALSAFPKLRVNFGHFGGAPTAELSLQRARDFIALMRQVQAPGANAYADAGFFVEVLGQGNPALLKAIQQLYDETADKGEAALANRFMYGTDWLMTLAHGSVAEYLDAFLGLLDRIERRPALRRAGITELRERFIGANAASWLGLANGAQTRTRLDRFYRANGVRKPDWAFKVDRQ